MINDGVKSEEFVDSSVVFFCVFDGPLNTFLEAIGASKFESLRPLGGIWEIFWRRFRRLLKDSGCSLGRFGGIFGALSPKMGPRI